MMIATTVAAGIAAVIGTPLVLALTWWTQQTPQRLAHLSSFAVLFPVTGGLVAGVALLTTHGTSTLVAGIPILILGGAAALTDVRELRLPNRLTGPLLLCALITLVITAARTGDPSITLRGLAASAAAATMMAIARVIRPAAVGWGDVKFATSLGCYLGITSWQATYAGLLLWWVLIAILAALALIAGALRRTDPLPYGPAMLSGTLLAIAVTS